MSGNTDSSGRTRWAAFGAAVAVTVGVGGGIAVTNATTSTGERAVYVPITPCRLFDTRASDQVGPRGAPLIAGESFNQAVLGTNGNCTIPADATGVAMNVTVTDPTAAGYLTIWPTDAARPLASSLNWVPAAPPTPNKVDTKVSADGQISLFTNAGTVNVLADVVGYYVDHNHDDRYYTKPQADTALGTKADKPTGVGTLVVDAVDFKSDDDMAAGFSHDNVGGFITSLDGTRDACASSSANLPNGAVVTGFIANLGDSAVGFKVSARLDRDPIGFGPVTNITAVVSDGLFAGGDLTLSNTAPFSETIDAGAYTYSVVTCGLRPDTRVYDVIITYTYPS